MSKVFNMYDEMNMFDEMNMYTKDSMPNIQEEPASSGINDISVIGAAWLLASGFIFYCLQGAPWAEGTVPSMEYCMLVSLVTPPLSVLAAIVLACVIGCVANLAGTHVD